MPQQSWSPKRERQYDHIKDGVRERGETKRQLEHAVGRNEF